MTNYAASIKSMYQSVLREAKEGTPDTAEEIRIVHTPDSLVKAGQEVMKTPSRMKTDNQPDE